MPERTSYEHGTPSWVDVASADVDATVSFYEQLFGWEGSEPGDPEETGGYRMLTQDGKAVAGAMSLQDPGQPPSWTTYISVDDADAAAERVKAAGGSVLVEPMDVMSAGRMAVFVDPEGAAFAVWQSKDHIGSELVNEPNSLAWNELRTRDPDGAKAFYTGLFGWEPLAFPDMEGYTIWTVGGSAPENGKGGMIDMATVPMPAEAPPHWNVNFAVADADATAARCAELGGTVIVPPMDSPVGRMAGLQDPAGAMFTVIKLSPPA